MLPLDIVAYVNRPAFWGKDQIYLTGELASAPADVFILQKINLHPYE